MGLGVAVGELRERERHAPRFVRLRRLRRALWSVIDPVEVRDIDLDVYESGGRLLDEVNQTLAAAGLAAHREPPRGEWALAFDLPSDGLRRFEERLGEALVDVYLPRELEHVVQGDAIRIASTRQLRSACERVADGLAPLPDPHANGAAFDVEDEERLVCAILLAATDASVKHGAAVVIG